MSRIKKSKIKKKSYRFEFIYDIFNKKTTMYMWDGTTIIDTFTIDGKISKEQATAMDQDYTKKHQKENNV